MSKMWKVFLHEYKRHVFRKRFIFAVLSMPFVILAMMGIGIVAMVLEMNTDPVGYVDHSGLLADPIIPPQENGFFSKPIQFIPYSGETEAQGALDAGEIQAYYVLSPDYLETSKVRLVAMEQPDGPVQGSFTEFLQLNLLVDQPTDVAHRFTEGTTMIIQSVDGSREMAESDWFNLLIPLLAGVLFMIVILTSGGYLLQAVVEEKENRTMEIVITSVSPDQLMAGKVLGNLCVGLTQLVAWILFGLIAILVGRSQFDWMARMQIGWDYLILMVVILLPTFVMIAGLMAAIGATVTEVREAQQVSGLFTMPIMVPYYFTAAIMANPNGPLALGLSYFPLTAPVTLTLRAGFTQIPTVQIALNVALLTLCAVGAIWLAARTFRMGMLSYGKRISWKQVFRKQS